MTYPEIRAVLARERQDTLLAEARAARAGATIWLTFPRIIDIPFEECMAALESWQRPGRDGELRIGRSRLRGPIVHDRDGGTGQIEVGLARGPLRAPRRMRLEVSRWSPSSSRTTLELVPCGRVRPTAAYFRSGHLLLDSLAHSLQRGSERAELLAWPAAAAGRLFGLDGGSC
jgi:hypothetical protein